MAKKRPWGAMGDHRSRLHRLAIRIYNAELKPLYPVSSKLGERRLRTAAAYLAQAQMVLDQVKADDRVTPKRHVLLTARAEMMLTRLMESEKLAQSTGDLAQKVATLHRRAQS